MTITIEIEDLKNADVPLSGHELMLIHQNGRWRSITVDNLLTGVSMPKFPGIGDRVLEANSVGDITATRPIKIAAVSDSLIISELENPSNWDAVTNIYTGTTALSVVFGDQYFSDVTNYNYVVCSNGKIKRY